jgi:hypothetical protein
MGGWCYNGSQSNRVRGCGLNSSVWGYRPVAGYCERSYKLTASLKGREFLDKPSDCQFPRTILWQRVMEHWTKRIEIHDHCVAKWDMPNFYMETYNKLSYEGLSQSFQTESITKWTKINTRCETTQKVMATELTRLTHKIAIQLYLVAESCTMCQFSLHVASPETFGYTVLYSYCVMM